MAYVHSSNSVNSNNTQVSEIVCPLPAFDIGDLAVVTVCSRIDTGSYQQKTGTSGWTLHNNTNTGTYTFSIFYKFLTNSETDPTFEHDSGGTEFIDAVITVVKDADTTPIVASAVSQANRPMNFDIITVDTTGYDDCLLLHTGTASYSRNIIYDSLITQYESTVVSNNCTQAGYFQKQYGGVTDAIEVQHEYSGNFIIGETLIAIKNAPFGFLGMRGHVNPSKKPAKKLQGFHWAHFNTENATSLISTLDGGSSSLISSSNTNNKFSNVSDYPQVSRLTSNTSNRQVFTANLYDTSEDLSDALVQVTFASGSYDSSLSYDKGGRYIGLVTGALDGAKLWKVEAADTRITGKAGVYPYIFDTLEPSTESFGTVDLSDSRYFSFGITRDSTTDTVIGYLYKLEEMELVYGNVFSPCSFSDAVRHANNASLRTVQNQGGQATNQFYITQNIRIGNNGVNKTIWNSDGQSVEFPSPYSIFDRSVHHRIGEGRLHLIIDGGVDDSISVQGCSFDLGNLNKFVLDSASRVETAGLKVANAEVSLLDNGGEPIISTTFSSCKELTSNLDLSGGNIIEACVDPYAITVSSEAEYQKIANCEFRGNFTSIKITGDQTGVWSDANQTFSGNTVDIEYTGTTDFTISATSPITVNNTSTGTLTIAAPVITQGVEFNNLVVGSQVVIYYAGTDVEIDRTNSSGTTFSWTQPYGGDGDIDYTIMKEGLLPIRGTDLTLSSSVVPVSVSQSIDRSYAASAGLSYGTNVVINTTNKTIDVSTATTVQNLYSALIEFWLAESTLRNIKFPIATNGPNSFTCEDGWVITSGSINNLSRDGLRFKNVSGAVTDIWCAILSVGNINGTAEYQTVNAAAPTDAKASGNVDQLIKIFEDGVFDYTNYLKIKAQPNGYNEDFVDVVSQYGTLEDQLYVVAMNPEALVGFTNGNPAPTGLSLTNHGASPVSWNGKNFSITITDTGANYGETIWRWLNYNKSLDATFQGEEPFNLFDMVQNNGSSFETQYGEIIGAAGSTLKGVRVVDGSGNPHPDFSRFQADDGSYYTVPITANVSISNIATGSRLYIYNETTATEVYNDVPGTGYTSSYIDGTTYSAGDVVTVRITQTSGVTAKLPYSATAVASSAGWSIIATQEDDSVYNQFGINGSSVTKFSADYANSEVDLVVTSNFSGDEFYAWWAYNLTTVQGIRDYFGGITATDSANLRINNSIVDIYWDNATTTNVYQTDNVRIYRVDGAYPVRTPTSGGGGIDVVWRDKVYIAVTGSGVTAQDKTDIKNLVFDEVIESSETFKEQLRLLRASAAGLLSKTGTTVKLRDAADTKDRVTATVDTDGQRTSITTDAS